MQNMLKFNIKTLLLAHSLQSRPTTTYWAEKECQKILLLLNLFKRTLKTKSYIPYVQAIFHSSFPFSWKKTLLTKLSDEPKIFQKPKRGGISKIGNGIKEHIDWCWVALEGLPRKEKERVWDD